MGKNYAYQMCAMTAAYFSDVEVNPFIGAGTRLLLGCQAARHTYFKSPGPNQRDPGKVFAAAADRLCAEVRKRNWLSSKVMLSHSSRVAVEAGCPR